MTSIFAPTSDYDDMPSIVQEQGTQRKMGLCLYSSYLIGLYDSLGK